MATAPLRKKIYWVLHWSTVAGLVLTLVLVLRKSPPPSVPYDPNASLRAGEKLAAAEQAQAAGKPAQVQIDRTELNSYLADNLQLANTPPPGTAPDGGALPAATGIAGTDQPTLEEVQSSVKDVRVDTEGDLVKAYVVFDFHGKDLSLELDGHLRSQDGYLKFDPVAGKLGSLPLPQSTLDEAVQKMMDSPENRDKLRLPPGISDVQIANGQAVISYK